MHLFPSSIYQQRRQILRSKFDSGLLLFMGNEESPMNYKDNVYPFRQDSTFLYYFGIDLPGFCALIDLDEDAEMIFGPQWTVDDIVWMGPQESLSALAQKVGVAHSMSPDKMAEKLVAASKAERHIHFLPPYRAENMMKLEKYLGIPTAQLGISASVPFIQAVVEQRSIKQAEELVELEKALTITAAMHQAAMQKARPGQLEAELTGIVQGISMGVDSRPAYPIILTINGQTLHNHHHHNLLQSGQLVLGDFGSESTMHYAGDVTRTFPVDKAFSSTQRSIYQIVLDAQLAAVEALKPGIAYKDVHLLAARKMAEGLRDLGILKGDVTEAVHAGAHALFFPHGLGHMLGLDVHDMEDLGENHVGYDENIQRSDQFGLAYLRLGRQLQQGFVLTVEPGLYFIPELIDQWQAAGKFQEFINYKELENWRSFSGIRIEDNYVITEEGARLIGPAIPKTIAEVEQLRQSQG
ncbi:MAG: aminopeptidase P family protein [Bacteroidota bacterium]